MMPDIFKEECRVCGKVTPKRGEKPHQNIQPKTHPWSTRAVAPRLSRKSRSGKK